MQTTKPFVISNTASGAYMGLFWAGDEDAALRALMRDAGSNEEPSDDLEAEECQVDNRGRIAGRGAIEAARCLEALGAEYNLGKYGDPTEDARDGLTIAEAEEIAAEDPNLIYLIAEVR